LSETSQVKRFVFSGFSVNRPGRTQCETAQRPDRNIHANVHPHYNFEKAGIGAFFSAIVNQLLFKNHLRLVRITYYIAMKLDT
jgi:hypothetical protein